MKQVSILVPLACLLFAVALTAQIPGELPITNPGFEAGDASGWNMWPGDDPKVSIVTDMVSEGVNAAKISGASGAVYKMVSSEVDIVAGTFYCIVADVLIPSADPLQEGQSVYLAGKAEGSATEWFESAKVVTSADDADTWYRLSAGLTYPADASGLNAEFKWTGTGSDDPSFAWNLCRISLIWTLRILKRTCMTGKKTDGEHGPMVLYPLRQVKKHGLKKGSIMATAKGRLP